MTRGGRRKVREEPERRCLVTRATAPRRGLVRFVLGPGDLVVPDLAARLPGRGMWVSSDRAALETAVRKNLFARAARRAVRAEADLPDRVEAGLAQRVVDLIALARRAGAAVAGREKVRERLVSGRAALLVQAADGSPRERAALRPPAGEDSLVSVLYAHELGMAFGRDRVIHAALDGGGLTDRVMGEALRLAGFRSDAPLAGPDDVATGDRPRDERLVRNG
jgi:uncharacterized protein